MSRVALRRSIIPLLIVFIFVNVLIFCWPTICIQCAIDLIYVLIDMLASFTYEELFLFVQRFKNRIFCSSCEISQLLRTSVKVQISTNYI